MQNHSLFLSDLFPRAGLIATKVKLVRYSLLLPGPSEAFSLNQLFEFSQLQKPNFYENIDYVLVFVGAKGNTAKFIGCYSTTGIELPLKEDLLPKTFPKSLLRNPNNVFHPLEETSIFKDLENRLFIDWQADEDIWYQTGQIDKPVLYIQNTGKYVYQGSQSVVLSFDELEEIIMDPILYASWHTALSTMTAIYLITDLEAGIHFIGSSYTPNSILSTWSQFVENHHGNNHIVHSHLLNHPDNYRKFQFSILQVLPNIIEEEDILEIKKLYRKKLGKNARIIED